MRGARGRVDPERFRDARGCAVEDARGGLGRDVAGAEARPARGQNDLRARSELEQRGGDRVALVGDDPALDLVPVAGQQLGEEIAAPILALAGRDAVRDGEDSRPQDGTSFVFSSRRTSSMTISLSTAFAMS